MTKAKHPNKGHSPNNGQRPMYQSVRYSETSLYLWPSISTIWNLEQLDLLTSLRQNNTKLVLSGDEREDNPGHCGSYTVVKMSCNKVVHFELVQVL